MSGSVVTFYSYKGGVGRSFLLANVGCLLSRWGYRVLCVDWDIEAPGLDEYFRPWMGQGDVGGLVDFALEFRDRKEPDWRRHTIELTLPQSSRPLSVMSAGKPGLDYMSRVQRIDWRELYDKCDFGRFLEQVRAEWKEAFDFVLVDSRTGVTDIGGICTVHLPDILVPVSTANRQGVDGVLRVLQQAIAQRDQLPLNRAGLQVLPVLSRFDTRVQDEVSGKWLRDFAEKIETHYDSWLDTELTARRMVDLTRIPYFPSWSFGERLAVLEEEENDSESISYHFATIAALIARRLGDTDQLVQHGRDGYVAAARAAGRGEESDSWDYFVSYSTEVSQVARDVARLLKRHGQSVFIDTDLSVGEHWQEKIEAGLLRSRNVLFFMPPKGTSRWLSLQVEFALSLADEGVRKRIVPIVLGDSSDLPPPLQRFQGIDARGLTAEEIVEELLPDRSSDSADVVDGELTALATKYLAINARDSSARLSMKEETARLMGHFVLERSVPRDVLTRSENEGLILALAAAIEMDPQPGDVNRLIEAGPKVRRMHVAYRILTAVGQAATRERVIPSQRVELERLLSSYEERAAVLNDRPLGALVETTRWRLAKLS